MKDIYSQLIIPEDRKLTSIRKEEAEFIFKFLKNKKINLSLEVGFAFGCSTVYIMAAIKALHYTIDPNQKKHYENLGLLNVKKMGFKDRLVFKNTYSHEALPGILKNGKKFDFIFIDGGHKFDEVFIDFYYTDLLLNQDGYVLFHDSFLRSIQHVSSWIKNNKKNYKIIKTPIKNLILFQKKGIDDRNWYHFNDFCILKPWYSQLRSIFPIKIRKKNKI